MMTSYLDISFAFKCNSPLEHLIEESWTGLKKTQPSKPSSKGMVGYEFDDIVVTLYLLLT